MSMRILHGGIQVRSSLVWFVKMIAMMKISQLVQNQYIRSSAVGLVLFLIALALNYVVINLFINTIQSPETYDLFFHILPVSDLEYILAWGILINVGLALAGMMLAPRRIAFVLYTLGLLYMVRAFFISITPLGVPADRIEPFSGSLLQQISYGGNDFFFSGHVAFPFMCALLFWDIPWVRNGLLGMTSIFAVGVLLARTHYSIDVFAAPFIVFAVFVVARFVCPQEWEWFTTSVKTSIQKKFPFVS